MHTDLDNIEKLLEKYLNAETTLQEEALLQHYFINSTVAPHLQEYQYMFQYFDTEKSARYTKSIRLKTYKNKRKWMSIAAGIMLFFGLFSYKKYKEHQVDKAYNNTRMALQIIAKQMNRGTIAITELNKIEQSTQKVFKKK